MSEVSSLPPGLHVEHTVRDGAGRAVLFAHGFGGSARNFRPQMRAVRDACETLGYDARGHARSRDVVDGGFALERLVADLRAVASRASAPRRVLCGLSLGAATALEAALAAPSDVEALVLAALPPGAGRAGGFSGDALAFADAVEREGLEAAGARFVWGEGSRLDERGAALVRQGFLEHSPSAIAALLRETIAALPVPEERASRLRAHGIPTLVVCGSEDAPSLEASRAFVAAAPECELIVVEGAGHVVNLAARDAFDRALTDFLATLGP